MGDDLLPELGDLVFSVLIGYAGALQFFYVVRHLYHWSCGHMVRTENDGESLKRLQERMRNELAEAEAKELQAGTQVMKDGLLYKDGYRTDAEQLKNDRLRAEQSTPEAREKRKKEIESELKRQKEIEEKTRAQLAEAEAQLEQQRKQAAEELAARQQAEEERAKEAEREEARKLLEIEQMRAEEERRREVEEEARRKREAEEEARRKQEAEEEARRVAQEEAARKRAVEEEIKRQEQEEVRKAAEEEAKQKRAAEEEEKCRLEEQARKAAEEEEMAQKLAEEEEAQRRREVEALRAAEANAASEAEEQSQKLLEAERQLELEQRKREAEEQAETGQMIAEGNAAREAEEQSQKLLEAERRRELEQRKREAEEQAETGQMIAEANAASEAEEQSQKLLEAERQRELEQRKREAEEQAETGQMIAEGNAAREAEEQSQKLVEAERLHELEQRKREAEEEAIKGHIENWTGTNNREDEEEDAEHERKLFETEQLHEEDQREYDMEEAQNEGESESAPDEEEEEEIKFNRMFANEALASKKQNELGEAETLDSIMQLLDAESDRQMREKEFEEAAARERDEKQRLIEENARKFLEADQEMEQLLESVQKQRRLSATESAPQSPVFEEPCIRKTMSPLSDNSDSGGGERVTQTVKTQFGQTSNEPYSLTTKPLIFKSISDDAPSLEPHSSLSAQPSDEFEPDAYETLHNTIDVQFTQLERQAPDGEDNGNTSPTQYTDDYLRSLDGIKQRPLVREDGSGRRRAFKKRRSSGSSNSSFESRASREEELKMFTSLEEEELQATKEGETDFTPIKYSNEQLLKVKPPRRRHKRSPAKDAKPCDRSLRGSLEMLNEEANTNPWGEVAPEHYKDMPFWKHEKSMSIDEETIESELPAAEKEEERDVNARNLSTASAFEEATNTQNEAAITVLQRQKTKDEQETVDDQQQPMSDEPARSDIQPNLQTKQNITPSSPVGRKSTSPRLRRSPRIDEIDQYEQMWNKANEPISAQTPTTPTTPNTPSITINRAPDNAPWRDQYGLLMEGISDFYDFTAMVNPSRSRSTSRQVSPASSQPFTPAPKNVECKSFQGINNTPVDVYDDTGNIVEVELTKENVVNFIESLQNDCVKLSQTINDQLQNVADSPNVNEAGAEEGSRLEMSLLVQTLRVERQSRSRSCSPLPTGEQLNRSVELRGNKLTKRNDELLEALNLHISDNVNATEQTLNIYESPSSSTEEASMPASNRLLAEEQRTRSRSRSRSPLPTPNNLARSLETRRSRRIKQNDELIEKLGLDINTSQAPSPTELHSEKSPESPESPECDYSKESISLLVESLRVERTHSHSRSRSRSPLPTAENIRTGLEHRRKKKIQQNDELFQQLNASTSLDMKSTTAPIISIQDYDEEPANDKTATGRKESDCSVENMTSLVQSLRLRRSRSKSPMRRLERERTPEPSSMRVGIIESDELSEGEDEHDRRSRTPSRSVSISPTRNREDSSQTSTGTDFHVMLNLEASQNRTLFKCSEELESILAEKQRQVDAEALCKLSNASEEMELRTVTPVTPSESEDKNKLMGLPFEERLRQLRCSPTTPDYDRTISQEWNDVQRIKDEILASGFKRSTYVGESLDLGSEFAPLREQTAHFRRSRSPSPSLVATESLETAEKRREVQDKILSELILASAQVADMERLGAKPKELRSLSKEIQETQYDELRRLNAEFQRSRSQSRSPLGEVEAKEVQQIEGEAKKREFEDKLNSIEKSDINFQTFSRYLNAGFLDNERRASDSALIQKPEVIIQLQELEEDFDVEPENYHHFRRFSLNQEQSIEEYPNDDYVFVSQIEVQTPKGTRTWIREDYYSEDFDQISLISEEMGGNVALAKDDVSEAMEEHFRVWEEEETDGSEDERQTVVEVEDEIDEDICDFNERGPADESHHEQSECEEAEREMDRYAGREANDWQHVDNIDELLADDILLAGEEEGAVGGGASALDYDSDSAAIDEIYDEAIKNRKQSGILRDYDSILKEMQKNYIDNAGTTDGSEGDMSATSDNEPKKGETKKEDKPTLKLIKNEHREHELRYLGDASVHERQSTRLRTRYGYMPQLHGSGVEDLDMEVDLSYKPKREYNWRKNFKIEDDEADTKKEEKPDTETSATVDEGKAHFDLRKFSLGGESITLFSQGAEGICYEADENQLTPDTIQEETEYATNEVAETTELSTTVGLQEELVEKPKKKKSKKKLRRESRTNGKEYYTKDDDDSENQCYSRRNSSIQMETDSPKRTVSRSRRNSKTSLINDELNGSLFPPRSSVVAEEPLASLTQEGSGAAAEAATKKKLKKRKKTKEAFGATDGDIKEELGMQSLYFDLSVKVSTASEAVSPVTASINPLATLSPQPSICTPTSSVESETPELKELLSASSAEGSPTQRAQQTNAVEAMISAAADALLTAPATAPDAVVTAATRTSTTPTTTTRTSVDTFDMLKDANFYPLF